jgi:hypothetical protein
MERIEFLSPVGRLVGGSPFEPQTKDHKGQPLVIRSGPNAGQPTKRFFMALAIAKNDPALGAFMNMISQAGQTAFPNLFDPSGNCIHPDFAWKFKDGDSQIPDTKGNRPCDKEGYPGHFVFGFSGSHPPKVHGDDPSQVLTDPATVKRGYYIRILGSVVGNDEPSNPGVYLNYSCVQFVAFGPEIKVGPDGTAAFSAAPIAALPAGASKTPLAPTAAPAPAMPGPLPAMAASMPPAPVTAAPPAPAPAPAAVKYVINGTEYTRDALVAAGYTEQQIQACAVQ